MFRKDAWEVTWCGAMCPRINNHREASFIQIMLFFSYLEMVTVLCKTVSEVVLQRPSGTLGRMAFSTLLRQFPAPSYCMSLCGLDGPTLSSNYTIILVTIGYTYFMR